MSFSGQITIRDANDSRNHCTLSFTDQGAMEQALDKCDVDLLKDERKFHCFKAFVMPIRTNNCKNFAKDLFLPNVVHTALNVKNIVARVFLMLLSLPLDLATLPIRLLMAIPRYYANKKAPEHRMLAYLRTQPSAAKLLHAEQVFFSCNLTTVKQETVSSNRSVFVPSQSETNHLGKGTRTRRMIDATTDEVTSKIASSARLVNLIEVPYLDTHIEEQLKKLNA